MRSLVRSPVRGSVRGSVRGPVRGLVRGPADKHFHIIPPHTTSYRDFLALYDTMALVKKTAHLGTRLAKRYDRPVLISAHHIHLVR